MSQHDLSETSIKCHVCNGAGYHLSIHGMETIERECSACHGTGLSPFGQSLESLEDVFTCGVCGSPKVHYRLRGYVCPVCEKHK